MEERLSAKQEGIEGHVVLEFEVTNNGTVDNIRIIDSEPGQTFDSTAKKAVALWRYKPRSTDNSVVVTQVFNFTLDGVDSSVDEEVVNDVVTY